MKTSYVIIGFWLVLFIAAILIVNTSLLEEQVVARAETLASPGANTLPIEEGVFKLAGRADELRDLFYRGVGSTKGLAPYYSRRAFPGAPPVIPHPADEQQDIGGKACLQCHQNGGYVDQYQAFAPVSPHPELLNCKQCHVPVVTTGSFIASSWRKPKPPETGQQELPGSPPVIPHALEMRNNCLSCHGSPAAPREIRVSHPDRVNCRQCHALNDNAMNAPETWTR